MLYARKFITILFALVQLIILVGLSLQGVFMLWTRFFWIDRLYGALYLLAGFIFSVVLINSVRPLLKRNNTDQWRRWWRNHKIPVILTTAMWLVAVMGLHSIDFLLLYGGNMLGGFIISQARLGWLRLSSIDIYKLHALQLTWLFEWYFLYMIIGGAYDWLQRRKIRRTAVKKRS